MPNSPRPGSQPHAVLPGALQALLVLDLAWRLRLGKKIGSILGPGGHLRPLGSLAAKDR
jgi:hypothetical protein